MNSIVVLTHSHSATWNKAKSDKDTGNYWSWFETIRLVYLNNCWLFINNLFTASQMWCSTVLLPLIIGELVDSQDVDWECFCLLLTITNYAFAPVTTEDAAMFLKEKINDFQWDLSQFSHYTKAALCCTPARADDYISQLTVNLLWNWCVFLHNRYGPPVRYWCMWFEAKHAYFKSLAHRIKNFKNIPKSQVSRHQHKMCYVLSTGKHFCLKETNCGKIK